MRVSRPCYDKPHRCPGWAGGGLKYPPRDRPSRCDNGQIRTRIPMAEFGGEFEYPSAPRGRWHFGHCTTCDVVTWPWALTFLDPTRLRSRILGRQP